MRPTERPLHFLVKLAKNTLAYIKNFIQDPDVASIMPSSPFLVRRLMKKMDPGGRCVVVEYGPAAGVLSRPIIERMGPEGRLLLVETNENFVHQLREQFAHDPRVEIFHQQAQDVSDILRQAGETHADYVLSGIPFSFLEEDERHALIEATRQALRPGGQFLVYQHYGHMDEPLRQHFDRVERDFEPINLPPIHIHVATRVGE